MDGELSAGRIARVIEGCEPDLVALQELDVGRLRTRGADQARELAEALGMRLHFHPALREPGELYGDAILTAGPSALVKADALPGLADKPRLEPRGALWVAAGIEGGTVQILNTHLGLRRRERLAQVEALLGPEWLCDPRCRGAVVLAGDLNALPRSLAYRRLAGRLQDAPLVARAAGATYPAYLPLLRIDHVFANEAVQVLGAEVVRSPLARVASDHLPLVVDFRLRTDDGNAGAEEAS